MGTWYISSNDEHDHTFYILMFKVQLVFKPFLLHVIQNIKNKIYSSIISMIKLNQKYQRNKLKQLNNTQKGKKYILRKNKLNTKHVCRQCSYFQNRTQARRFTKHIKFSQPWEVNFTDTLLTLFLFYCLSCLDF